MIRTTARVTRRQRRCDRCSTAFPAGSVYLEHVMSPGHDGLGYEGWVRSPECADCARLCGRVEMLEPAARRPPCP